MEVDPVGASGRAAVRCLLDREDSHIGFQELARVLVAWKPSPKSSQGVSQPSGKTTKEFWGASLKAEAKQQKPLRDRQVQS